MREMKKVWKQTPREGERGREQHQQQQQKNKQTSLVGVIRRMGKKKVTHDKMAMTP
jgi:hypothetical protein